MRLIRLTTKIHYAGSKRILFLIMGVMMGYSAGAQVQEIFLKSIALADQGAYQEARTELEKALSLDSDNPAYLLKLAEVCYNSGDTPSALNYCERLNTHAPGKGSYLLATIYAESGNTGEALKYLEIHLDSQYKLPSDKILLDDAFFSLEDSPEWKKLWSRDWYSADEELLQEIRYLTVSGEYLQSLETIDEELPWRKNWDELHAARGKVLLKMGQYQGAIQSYSDAIALASEKPEHYYGRASVYIMQGNYRQAIPDLEKTVRMEPERLDLLLETGAVYHKAGQLIRASDYLDRYLEYYPDHTEARFLAGQILFDSKKYIDALDQYNACLRLDTGDPRFFKARGKTYMETKTYKYALNDLGMALDLDPYDPETWYLKGEIRWLLNERQGAIRDWEQAARLGSYDAARKLEEMPPGTIPE
ncbi:tetratricopeptide repeat protein [Bacteroidota bacterium]